MAISDDLFQAILAMDAYNRGVVDPKLIVTGPIGDATLLDVSPPAGSAEASFFAQAYTLSNEQTVISFSGTDAIAGDLLSG